MLVKIITLKFSDAIEGFDDEPLRAFMAGRAITEVKEKFFVKDNTPYWAVMLTYNETPKRSTDERQRPAEPDKKKQDYRKILTEEATPLFNLLREWRTDRCRKDGVPQYVAFNNMELAEIAVKKPETPTGLLAVPGVGKVKIEKYGEDVLHIIKTANRMLKKDDAATSKPPPDKDDPPWKEGKKE